ncbi:hypothetical protein, partial [Stenotrophomonas sp. SrG]|uniref:hypothetical protein n=1 Tax=Stenotrophomonas sp. SrG TaxID=3414430 RepID=UPI003CF3086A
VSFNIQWGWVLFDILLLALVFAFVVSVFLGVFCGGWVSAFVCVFVFCFCFFFFRFRSCAFWALYAGFRRVHGVREG